MNLIIEYFTANGARYGEAVLRHLWISGLSVFAAFVLAAPLGVVCAANRRLSQIITGLFSALRIIPSLAILFLCIPVMGTGVKPSIAALCALAIPPMLINTTLAFSTLPAALLEAAGGLGMGRQRIFWTVKVPLALPFVLTGLKTAAVEVIASATLAAYIGGGGLGAIIFTGLGLMKVELLVIGGLSVAVLSLACDFLLNNFERCVTQMLFGKQPA
jgi:osmoprotectant transport system permease protein